MHVKATQLSLLKKRKMLLRIKGRYFPVDKYILYIKLIIFFSPEETSSKP